MINLIPIEEKKKMVKSFYLRLSIVILIALGFTMLIATSALLPAYFFAEVKKDAIELKIETEKKNSDPSTDLEISTLAKEIENKITKIENFNKNKFIVSERVLNAVILNKMSDIKITKISFDGSGTTRIIRVNGSAQNRDRLTLFKHALEEDTLFQKVDLPISNFVRGSNINFFLTITPS